MTQGNSSTPRLRNELRILKRASAVADEYEFVDEDGRLLPEFGTMRLSFGHKVFVARKSIEWHQSIQRTMERMVATAARQYARKRLANV